jgi:hypothetical protein
MVIAATFFTMLAVEIFLLAQMHQTREEVLATVECSEASSSPLLLDNKNDLSKIGTR